MRGTVWSTRCISQSIGQSRRGIGFVPLLGPCAISRFVQPVPSLVNVFVHSQMPPIGGRSEHREDC